MLIFSAVRLSFAVRVVTVFFFGRVNLGNGCAAGRAECGVLGYFLAAGRTESAGALGHSSAAGCAERTSLGNLFAACGTDSVAFLVVNVFFGFSDSS